MARKKKATKFEARFVVDGKPATEWEEVWGVDSRDAAYDSANDNIFTADRVHIEIREVQK